LVTAIPVVITKLATALAAATVPSQAFLTKSMVASVTSTANPATALAAPAIAFPD